MNELLGAAARFSRGLAVQFGLEEQEGVPTVAPEIMPTSDIHSRPEQWHLMGGVLLQGMSPAVPNGGAGTRSQIAIVPGAGELTILESIRYRTTGRLRVYWIAPATALAGNWSTTAAITSREARRIRGVGASPQSGCLLWQNGGLDASIAAAAAICDFAASGLDDHWREIRFDLVTVPEWRLLIDNGVDNTTLPAMFFKLRVRPATPRELAIGAV